MSTILVVDDATLPREAISILLEHEGFKTITAQNGREAWATMYHEKPDLVLLDLMMPEMDGITFLSMVRRSTLWHDLPLVVLTGVDDKDKLISRAWELRVSDLIPKHDCGFQDLVGRIRHHLEAAAALGVDVSRAGEADAGRILADRIIAIMERLKVPSGLKALGYSAADIPALVEGTLPQHRVTKLSPRPATTDDLARLFEETMQVY